MLAVLAKLGSPADVGQFSLALAVTAPIVVFSQMQLRQIQVTDTRGEFHFGHYLGMRLVATALALAVIVIVALTGAFAASTARVVVLLGISKSFESISDVLHGAIQKQDRMDRIAISLMLRGAVGLFGMGLIFALSGSLQKAALGLIAASGTVLLCYDLGAARACRAGRSLQPKWDPRAFAALVAKAAPMAGAAGLLSLSAGVPRYLLDASHGQKSVGYYAAVSSSLLMMTFLPNALGQASIARVARHFQAGETWRYLLLASKVTAACLLICAPFAAAGIFWARPLLTALYTAEYASGAGAMSVMILATLFSMLGVAGYLTLVAARQFWLLFANALLILASQGLFGWLLIPRYGLWGAAYAEAGKVAVTTTFLLTSAAYLLRAAAAAGDVKVRAAAGDG